MCAFVVHSALTLVVFAVVKMLSFRSLGVLVQPSQWVDVTLVHFRSFVWIIVSQSVPLFAFTLLGRSSRLAQWSPLRVDTAPSYGPPLHMYVVQVAANTMAALSFAVCLMESAGGSESLVAKADSGTNGTGGDTSIQLHWLHRYYIVCSALAAVACDTLRCFRNREHELVFPSMASESLPILERIPAFIADAALSALKWLLFSWLFLQLIVPQAGYAILWAARQCLQNNLGGDTITDGTNSAESNNFVKFILGFSASKILLTAVVGPIDWAVTVLKEFIDMDMLAITHMPAGVYWRATVTYGANYLLLSHGISVLKVLLTMPLDFLRAGAMVDARSSNQGDDVFIDDGPSVSQLLVQAMSYGWEKVREDAERPDFGDPQYAGDTYDSNYGFPSGPSSSEQLVMAHLGQDDYHQGFSGTRRRERFWVRLLDRQRRAVKRLAEGVAKRETTTMERIGGGSFSAAVRRAWTSLIHSYWAADGGVGGTVTMRAPIWNEQDVGISLFHQIVRALAFQYVKHTCFRVMRACPNLIFCSSFANSIFLTHLCVGTQRRWAGAEDAFGGMCYTTVGTISLPRAASRSIPQPFSYKRSLPIGLVTAITSGARRSCSLAPAPRMQMQRWTGLRQRLCRTCVRRK